MQVFFQKNVSIIKGWQNPAVCTQSPFQGRNIPGCPLHLGTPIAPPERQAAARKARLTKERRQVAVWRTTMCPRPFEACVAFPGKCVHTYIRHPTPAG